MINIGCVGSGGSGFLGSGGDTWFNATSLANAVSNGSSISVAAQGGQGMIPAAQQLLRWVLWQNLVVVTAELS